MRSFNKTGLVAAMESEDDQTDALEKAKETVEQAATAVDAAKDALADATGGGEGGEGGDAAPAGDATETPPEGGDAAGDAAGDAGEGPADEADEGGSIEGGADDANFAGGDDAGAADGADAGGDAGTDTAAVDTPEGPSEEAEGGAEATGDASGDAAPDALDTPAGADAGEGADPVTPADAPSDKPTGAAISDAVAVLAAAGVEVSAHQALSAMASAGGGGAAVADDVPVGDQVSTDAELAAPQEAGDTLESDLLEVAESEAEGKDAEAAIDSDVEGAETLDKLAPAIEQIVENGGMNRYVAEALGIAIDSIYARTGVTERKAVVSLESFGGTSTRISASQMVLESLNEQRKELWKKILEGIKKSIAWLKQRFEAMLGGAARLQRHANAIVAKATKLGNKPLKAGPVSPQLGLQLVLGAKHEGIPQEAIHFRAIVAEVLRPDSKASTILANALEKGDMGGIGQLFTKEAIGALGELTPVNHPASEGLPFTPPEGLQVVRSTKPMFGNKAIVAVVPTERAKAGQMQGVLDKCVITVTDGWPKQKPTGEGMKALDMKGVIDTAKAVAEYAGTITKFKSTVVAFNHDKERVTAAIERILSKGDVSDQDKDLVAIARAMTRLIDTPVAGFITYALSTGGALLRLCEHSLGGAAATAPGTAVGPAGKPAPAAAKTGTGLKPFGAKPASGLAKA